MIDFANGLGPDRNAIVYHDASDGCQCEPVFAMLKVLTYFRQLVGGERAREDVEKCTDVRRTIRGLWLAQQGPWRLVTDSSALYQRRRRQEG